MSYLAGPWKANQGGGKERRIDPVLLESSVQRAPAPADQNVMLMTEYKDLASMEANEDKAEALAQRVVGNDEKQIQGYKDRSEIREVYRNKRAVSP